LTQALASALRAQLHPGTTPNLQKPHISHFAAPWTAGFTIAILPWQISAGKIWDLMELHGIKVEDIWIETGNIIAIYAWINENHLKNKAI